LEGTRASAAAAHADSSSRELRHIKIVAAEPRSTQPLRIGSTLTVSELAFEYGRAVLALSAVEEETKTRALTWLADAIVPLAGTLHVDELTPELCRHVGGILVDEADHEGRMVAYVWSDLVRWGRTFLASRPDSGALDA
jgi:hypothetical protein